MSNKVYQTLWCGHTLTLITATGRPSSEASKLKPRGNTSKGLTPNPTTLVTTFHTITDSREGSSRLLWPGILEDESAYITSTQAVMTCFLWQCWMTSGVSCGRKYCTKLLLQWRHKTQHGSRALLPPRGRRSYLIKKRLTKCVFFKLLFVWLLPEIQPIGCFKGGTVVFYALKQLSRVKFNVNFTSDRC